jgi:hypothetical protein
MARRAFRDIDPSSHARPAADRYMAFDNALLTTFAQVAHPTRLEVAVD